jgi:hypothetical protein
MPPKATSAGGQASVLSDQSSWLSAYGSTTLSTETSSESSAASATSSESGSFVIATSTATSTPYQGAAGANVARTGAVMAVVGGVVALLL